mgnify:CR=1 FL=1|tara:strand:+ start:540 stop:1154 length:615 start_codon:yes stop_codon:yes gene_type:complete
MINIKIQNKQIINLLNGWSSWFDNLDKSLLKLDGKPDEDDYYTEEEYFKTIDQEKHVGFPEKKYGVDVAMPDTTKLNLRERIRQIDSDFNNVLSAKCCAVKMYYPKGGYMGWHNNHNASGYNILFSHTKNGKGYFRYKDPITLQTITMHDTPGWTAKVGYYGMLSEKNKIYWHCARAYEDRLTLGFVVPNKDFWEMMIEDIESI